MRSAVLLLSFVMLVAACDGEEEPGGPGLGPPVLTVPESAAGTVGDPMMFTVSAVDPDGDTFSLSAEPVLTSADLKAGARPGTVSVNQSRSEIWFTPSADDVPERYIEVTARDVRGQSSSVLVPVMVSDR